MSEPDIRAGLNPEQLDAVSTLRGPVLVLAGAGTGKTRVITIRVAELIRSGIAPDRILAVTFTNKAAKEMAQRASDLLGRRPRGGPRPFLSTFHSLCVNILRQEIEPLGYPKKFAILDRSDQESTARAALRDVRVGDSVLKPRDLLAKISKWKTAGLRARAVAPSATDDLEILCSAAYRRYEEALRVAGSLDFDDLLLCTEELFRRFPDALRRQQSRWDHIMVDEYQDTNASQYRIVSALARPHRNLFVVGDDDQAIYGFRGADVRNILGFDRDFPEAAVVRLSENYRCSPGILTLANRLIAHNPDRHEKVLRASRPPGIPVRIVDQADEVAEARWVVADLMSVLQSGRIQAEEIAVLLRTNEQPRAFESELRAQSIPYTVVGGMSFFDRKEVRDILAYLRVLVLPADEVALRRIINVPARGISAGAVEKLVAHAVGLGRPMWEAIPSAMEVGALPPRAVSGLRTLLSFLDHWRARLVERTTAPAGETLTAGVRLMIDALGYKAEIENSYKEVQDQANRWKTVEDVFDSITQYEGRSQAPALDEFLQETALWGREENDKDEKRRGITLMTLHSAKGLEFPHVYLVGLEEGILPHERSIAEEATIVEERRICYVGITRARDRLTITRARFRTKWGRPKLSIPSRFLFEMMGRQIPPEVLEAMERASQERAMTPDERARLRKHQRRGRPGVRMDEEGD